MPIHFIDNYPKNNLESIIRKPNGSPLFGEIWFYQELIKFNENNFLKDETWYVKHSFNLSTHPSSPRKVEGQIDYLILSQYGILVVEVKGGGIEVDENDVYFSYDGNEKTNRYESQNPFTQAKEYVHSLKSLIDSSPFIYRAVVFPHESGFELKGPQLEGYKFLFFSRKNLNSKDSSFAKNKAFFDFLVTLAKDARRNLVTQLKPQIDKGDIDARAWSKFPTLSKKEVNRLKSELFPIQSTYGFDPDRVKNEIILEENFEILNGLRKNRRVMVQGAPGTGKTVLATKFLAQNLLKQHKGVFFCANKLLRSKMEYLIHDEYKLDSNLISFRIYHAEINVESLDEDVDFIIIDEAQEFFDKRLFEFIENLESKLHAPKFLILYDPEQAIIQDFKDIDWYADFFVQSSFVHYLFDTVWRCCQNKAISDIADEIKNGQYKRLIAGHSSLIATVETTIQKLEILKDIIDTLNNDQAKYIFLLHSDLLDSFKEIVRDYFKNDFEELTETNVNVRSQKLRFTTPIKFRGLESENVVLITPELSEKTKIQNYVGVTRAMYKLKLIVWMQ